MRYVLALLLFVSCSKKEGSTIVQPDDPIPTVNGTWKQAYPDTNFTITIFQNGTSILGSGVSWSSCSSIPSITGTFANPNIQMSMSVYSCANGTHTETFTGTMSSDSLKGMQGTIYWVWVKKK